MDSFPTALKPDKITGGEQSYNTTIVKFEGKAEQRFANQHSATKKYTFTWNLMSNNLLLQLLQFHDSQLGAFREWLFTDSRLGPDPVVLRFTEDALPYSLTKGRIGEVEVGVTTV